jgi:hypothetical protein
MSSAVITGAPAGRSFSDVHAVEGERGRRFGVVEQHRQDPLVASGGGAVDAGKTVDLVDDVPAVAGAVQGDDDVGVTGHDVLGGDVEDPFALVVVDVGRPGRRDDGGWPSSRCRRRRSSRRRWGRGRRRCVRRRGRPHGCAGCPAGVAEVVDDLVGPVLPVEDGAVEPDLVPDVVPGDVAVDRAAEGRFVDEGCAGAGQGRRLTVSVSPRTRSAPEATTSSREICRCPESSVRSVIEGMSSRAAVVASS